MIRPIMRSAIGRRTVLGAAGGFVLSAPAIRAQAQSTGVALVIGNSKYQWESSLPNVKRDATDVAKRFQTMGLKTEFLQDLDGAAMRASIEKFKDAASGARLAAFYFAGHGVAWEKQTYIVPVDADLRDPKVALTLLDVPSVDAAMKRAASRLLVFDSCRNNPAGGWRQADARNQARLDAADKVAVQVGEANTLVLFSTAPGATALDGPPGDNSPFAAALLRQLDAQEINLQSLATTLRRDLLIATEGRQLVWDRNTFTVPFVLKGAGKASGTPPGHRDLSKIVELNNAYDFAHKSGLVLPLGLVGLRSASGVPNPWMVGSYKYMAPSVVSMVGISTHIAPAVIVVLSSERASAELVAAEKDWLTGGGSRWRYITATKVGKSISYKSADDLRRLTFRWTDQNSGQYSQAGPTSAGQGNHLQIRPVPFTRMDG